jgi:NAD(P)H-dependent FMN reductase
LSEQNTEQTIRVRQVTDVHANWSSQGFEEQGKFSYQLILDNGAEEAQIMPTPDDAKVLRDLIHDADAIYWDLDKEVLVFGKID